MAYVKAIVSPRVRKYLATPETRRAFLETYLGVRDNKALRFETVATKDIAGSRKNQK
jgi:hypothetical protein